MKRLCLSTLFFMLLTCTCVLGQTTITRWFDNKSSSISITYDGGTINQFRIALPIMNSMNLPATFYIVTGDISDAKYKGEFIGRPFNEILEEARTTPCNDSNFLERATAIRYAGSREARLYHTRAGDMFELKRFKEAYAHIDEAYAKIINGQIVPENPSNIFDNDDVDITWAELKEIAGQGHEFGSHTVTHPQLAIYDDANIKYEMGRSKLEILENLGEEHIFSAECPHGTENERVMNLSFQFHHALRNRMPEPFLEEINRWNRKLPGTSKKEYVQWQRGPKSSTPLSVMNSWTDTCLAHQNVWLVLTFHGVDGIGYEPVTSEDLTQFFAYIKENDHKIWVATFKDATKYIRQRMYGEVNALELDDKIVVELSHSLDPKVYNHPLTLKSYLPAEWSDVRIKQGNSQITFRTLSDDNGRYVLYNCLPNKEPVEITKK